MRLPDGFTNRRPITGAVAVAVMTCLESGVHIKAVADLLGHSSIAITGDVYGHTSDDTARAAIDALAGRLGLVDASGQ